MGAGAVAVAVGPLIGGAATAPVDDHQLRNRPQKVVSATPAGDRVGNDGRPTYKKSEFDQLKAKALA